MRAFPEQGFQALTEQSDTPRVEEYFSDLLKESFGQQSYMRILLTLSRCENGLCGVETIYFTYAALLLAQNVHLERSYVGTYGFPMSDGREAATPAQRKAIAQALQEAGFKIVIPPWFNSDFEPVRHYYSKRQ